MSYLLLLCVLQTTFAIISTPLYATEPEEGIVIQENGGSQSIQCGHHCGRHCGPHCHRSKHRCGTVPYPSNTGNVTPNPILDSPQVWSFVSAPELHPMKVTVNINKPCQSKGLIFLAPYAFSANAIYGQPGSLILDNEGNPVWFRPLDNANLMNTDFRVQTLYGKPVLTFWQGTLVTPPTYTNAPGGSSEPGSCYYILDKSYKIVKTVKAHKGYISDIHEFLITPDNTALLLSTKMVPMDLTPYGGPENGFVQDFAVQEIDLKTDKLLFFWSALDHIPLTDSFEPASSATETGNVWDAYHFNSISITECRNEILLSGRNTWTLYRICKGTGGIIWKLGGKRSDFIIEPEARFSWQHDARSLPNDVITLFDDNCCESATIPPETPPAHGLVLQLDLKEKSASLKRSYFHNPNLQVSSEGNVQTLKNGNRFIGWGQSQYYSEFLPAGNSESDPAVNMIYDAEMPGSNISYRAYRHRWVGTPHYPPSAAVVLSSGQAVLYASWNGSTKTHKWQVFAGKCPDRLRKIKTVAKKGFETAISVASQGPYFKVKALNAKGKVISVSKVISLQ